MDSRGRAARFWLALVVVSVAVAYAVVLGQRALHQLAEARADRDALRAQVVRMGGTPVAGEPGRDGATGPSGRDGKDGSDGSDGESGAPGTPGPSGSPGTPGAVGATGPAGRTGAPGPSGPVGPVGPSGAPGATGPQGSKGDKGDTGEPGESVTCAEGYHPEDIVITPYVGTYQVCKKDSDD